MPPDAVAVAVPAPEPSPPTFGVADAESEKVEKSEDAPEELLKGNRELEEKSDALVSVEERSVVEGAPADNVVAAAKSEKSVVVKEVGNKEEIVEEIGVRVAKNNHKRSLKRIFCSGVSLTCG